jgi:Protein of unknown function (DUF3237)
VKQASSTSPPRSDVVRTEAVVIAVGLCGLMMVVLSGKTQGPSPAVQPPKLTLIMTLRVQVGAPMELGQVPRGRRRIIPILGGTFEGPDFRGKVLAGGADWQIVRADGLAELDTRYALQTEQGSLIYIQNAGMRHAPPDITKKLLAGEAVDPAQVYFKTVPTFETSAAELQWLTRAIFVGTGERYPSEVIIRVWKVD